ncbi:MAG TPA: flagellar assembly protein H, partial [Cyanobacteria bacterium UBA12227]|nr:flagellar assembly protein H [Cyanobacteria bacterium UBA12227]
NFLKVKFGELSSQLVAIVEPLSALPPEELTLFLVQLSQLGGGTPEIQQGQRLAVEKLLQFKFGELDEELLGIVDSLLILPSQQLQELLLQLSRLSRSDFWQLLV